MADGNAHLDSAGWIGVKLYELAAIQVAQNRCGCSCAATGVASQDHVQVEEVAEEVGDLVVRFALAGHDGSDCPTLPLGVEMVFCVPLPSEGNVVEVRDVACSPDIGVGCLKI